jgi:signal peptide peptidase SppA
MIKMEIHEFAKGAIWAIMPDKFDLLSEKFFEYQFNADPGLIDQYKAQAGDGADSDPGYRLEGEVAVVDIIGPLTKRDSFFSFLFGGMSYAQISKRIASAIDDDRAGAIVLNIDSPGGVVSGVEAVSDLIYNSRGKKPILAYTDGLMASAAYWIGSAADVLFAEKTATVGSIGVLRIHVDYSQMEKKEGIKTTYLTAGKYKALGNDSQPLSDEAKNIFQAELDYIYSIFVDAVARNRDRKTEAVLSNMADGKIFIGYQAKDAGLIDTIGNYTEAAEMAASMINEPNYSLGGKTTMDINTIEQLTEAFPQLVLDIQESAAKKAAEDARAETAKLERKNLIELLKIQLGEETATEFSKLLDSNITPEQLEAVKKLTKDPESDPNPDADTEAAAQAAALEALQGSGAENPGADPTGAGGSEKDYMTMVREYQAEHECSIYDAMRKIDKLNPELRKTYIRKANA